MTESIPSRPAISPEDSERLFARRRMQIGNTVTALFGPVPLGGVCDRSNRQLVGACFMALHESVGRSCVLVGVRRRAILCKRMAFWSRGDRTDPRSFAYPIGIIVALATGEWRDRDSSQSATLWSANLSISETVKSVSVNQYLYGPGKGAASCSWEGGVGLLHSAGCAAERRCLLRAAIWDR